MLVVLAACGGDDDGPATPADASTTMDGDIDAPVDSAVPPSSFHYAFDMTGLSSFRDVVELSGGDLIAVGSVSSFGAGMRDAFIARLTADGAYVWSRALGTTLPDDIYAVADDGAGGVVVVGRTEYTSVVSFVARFDGAGNLLFSKNLVPPSAGTFIDSNLRLTDVVRMNDGNFALIGYHEDDDTTVAGSGVFRGWIGVIDPAGDFVRQRRFGSTVAYLGFYEGAVLPDGDLVVSGWWNLSTLAMRLDPDLTVNWRTTQATLSNDRGIDFLSILPLASGDIIFGGRYFEADFSNTVTHWFLQRLTGAGAGVWSRRLDHVNSGVTGLLAHGSGEFVALGYAPNTSDADAYAAILDTDGFLVSQHSLGLSGADSLSEGVVSDGGSLVVVGYDDATPYGSARIARIPSSIPTCDAAAANRLSSVTYGTAGAPDTTDFGSTYTVTFSTGPTVANGPASRTPTAICGP